MIWILVPFIAMCLVVVGVGAGMLLFRLTIGPLP